MAPLNLDFYASERSMQENPPGHFFKLKKKTATINRVKTLLWRFYGGGGGGGGGASSSFFINSVNTGK